MEDYLKHHYSPLYNIIVELAYKYKKSDGKDLTIDCCVDRAIESARITSPILIEKFKEIYHKEKQALSGNSKCPKLLLQAV